MLYNKRGISTCNDPICRASTQLSSWIHRPTQRDGPCPLVWRSVPPPYALCLGKLFISRCFAGNGCLINQLSFLPTSPTPAHYIRLLLVLLSVQCTVVAFAVATYDQARQTFLRLQLQANKIVRAILASCSLRHIRRLLDQQQ